MAASTSLRIMDSLQAQARVVDAGFEKHGAALSLSTSALPREILSGGSDRGKRPNVVGTARAAGYNPYWGSAAATEPAPRCGGPCRAARPPAEGSGQASRPR